MSMPQLVTDSEFGLLSAVMVDQSRMDEVMGLIGPGDFLNPSAGRLFAVLTDLHQSRAPFDGPTIQGLSRIPSLQPDWTAGQLARLILESVSGSGAKHHASEVRKASMLRTQQRIASDFVRRSEDPLADPNDVATWLEGQLIKLRMADTRQPETIGQVTRRVLDSLEPNGAGPIKAFTGVYPIDERTSGMCGGELIILAARTGCGKSSLALQTAIHNAEKGRRVLFVTLEMLSAELVTRWLAAEAEVDGRRLRSRTLYQSEIASIVNAASKADAIDLVIWNPARCTVGEIRATVRLLQNAGPLSLVIVDYVNKVTAAHRNAPRYQQIGEITGGLKEIAQEFEFPVMALCQLSREAEKTEKPQLNQLRESGDIEQDADQVLMLWHDKEKSYCVIGKHRAGETGDVELKWNPKQTRFEKDDPRISSEFYDFNNRGTSEDF